MDGWTSGGDAQFIPLNSNTNDYNDAGQKGSIKLKDSNTYSSFIEKEFSGSEIAHMNYNNEVTLSFDYCAVSLEDGDTFFVQFAIDDGSYYTFGEYEAGKNFDQNDPNNKNIPVCDSVSETFFFPATASSFKVKIRGGQLSQWDKLYIKSASVDLCRYECTPQPLDICVAIDISGSVCSVGNDIQGCDSCNCRDSSNMYEVNGVDNEDLCCDNFVYERDFATNLVNQANALDDEQRFSIVSFATESSFRVPNGAAGLADAASATTYLNNNFVYSGGWTNTGDAIAQCHASLAQSSRLGKVMVLLTDGQPTRGDDRYSNGAKQEHRDFAATKADAAKNDGVTLIPVIVNTGHANPTFLRSLGSDPGMMVEVDQFSALDATLNSVLALMQCTAGQTQSPTIQKSPTKSPSFSPTISPTPLLTKSPVTTPAPTDWYCEELDTFDFANGASGWVAPANSGYAAYYSSSQKALLLSHTSSQTRPTWTSPSFQSTNGQAQIIYDYKTEDHESYANDRFSLEYSLDNGGTWLNLQTHWAGHDYQEDGESKTDESETFSVPTTNPFKIRFVAKFDHYSDLLWINRVVVKFCSANSASPTTSIPTLSPVVPATSTPTSECVKLDIADFSAASDLDGWSLGDDAAWSSEFGGSIQVKDYQSSSSYIEKQFSGNMDKHSEVSIFLDFCAPNMDTHDIFEMQFSVDSGPYYTFAEQEKGPDFERGCGIARQSFFLPSGASSLKIRILGGPLSQQDDLYIRGLSLHLCDAACIEKKVDVCIALDRSGSVCSPLNHVQGCDSCNPTSSCHTPGLTMDQCCNNWVKNVEFADGLIDMLADGRDDQFSIVSFAGASSKETSGRVSAAAAKAALGTVAYSGGWTITGQAIADCKNLLKDSENDPVIILVTDGTPTRGAPGVSDGSYQDHKDWAEEKATQAKAHDIQIIPVVVDTGHTNFNFLKTKVASDPGATITVSDFDHLPTILDDVVGLVQCTTNRDPVAHLTLAPSPAPSHSPEESDSNNFDLSNDGVCVNAFAEPAAGTDTFDDCSRYDWGPNWNDADTSHCDAYCYSQHCPGTGSCIRLRNGSEPGDWEAAMYSDWIYVDGYANVRICFDFTARSFETGDSFFIREQSFNGGYDCWHNFEEYVAGTDFATGSEVTSQLCAVSEVRPGMTYMRLAISTNGDYCNDELWVDNVSVSICH